MAYRIEVPGMETPIFMTADENEKSEVGIEIPLKIFDETTGELLKTFTWKRTDRDIYNEVVQLDAERESSELDAILKQQKEDFDFQEKLSKKEIKKAEEAKKKADEQTKRAQEAASLSEKKKTEVLEFCNLLQEFQSLPRNPENKEHVNELRKKLKEYKKKRDASPVRSNQVSPTPGKVVRGRPTLRRQFEEFIVEYKKQGPLFVMSRINTRDFFGVPFEKLRRIWNFPNPHKFQEISNSFIDVFLNRVIWKKFSIIRMIEDDVSSGTFCSFCGKNGNCHALSLEKDILYFVGLDCCKKTVKPCTNFMGVFEKIAGVITEGKKFSDDQKSVMFDNLFDARTILLNQ